MEQVKILLLLEQMSKSKHNHNNNSNNKNQYSNNKRLFSKIQPVPSLILNMTGTKMVVMPSYLTR